MGTIIQLEQAVLTEIGNLSSSAPLAISIAGPSDDADTLNLAQEHCASVPNACSWGGIIQRGEQGVVSLRAGRVTVLARDKHGQRRLRGAITYVPADGTICWMQAIAAQERRPLAAQLRVIGAISIPVHRALLSLSYQRLITRTFPTDNRMLVFAGLMRTNVPLTVAEHHLDETDPTLVTHWSFNVDIAASLALFEGVGLG